MLFQDIFVIQRFTGLNLPLILLYHGCPDSKEAIRKSATESLITSPLFLNAAFWARHFTVLPLLMRKCRVLITRQEMPDKKGGKGKGKSESILLVRNLFGLVLGYQCVYYFVQVAVKNLIQLI